VIARLFALLCLLLVVCFPAQAKDGFVLKDIAGETHALPSYSGKWVIINFWATWCPPCLEEIPDLIALHEKHKNLSVIGVAVDYKSVEAVKNFVDDNLMSYPIVLGDDKVLQQFSSASVLPTTYIYNPQGNLVKIRQGLLTREYIEKIIAGK
jgi:thiol-disulfide isomerase/thioredoxin